MTTAFTQGFRLTATFSSLSGKHWRHQVQPRSQRIDDIDKTRRPSAPPRDAICEGPKRSVIACILLWRSALRQGQTRASPPPAPPHQPDFSHHAREVTKGFPYGAMKMVCTTRIFQHQQRRDASSTVQAHQRHCENGDKLVPQYRNSTLKYAIKTAALWGHCCGITPTNSAQADRRFKHRSASSCATILPTVQTDSNQGRSFD